MQDFTYCEFVKGDIKNRNQVFSLNDVKLPASAIECYRSLFIFNEDYKYFVKKTGSTKGYSGPHTADALIFDFDSPDLEEIRKETVNFVYHLLYNYGIEPEAIRISFSGNKGFHVLIPFTVIEEETTASYNFYKVYKSLADEISQDFGNDKSIYTLNRIMRLNNSINQKSGLYKIPLTFSELESFSIDEIKRLAKATRKIELLPLSELAVNPTLNELYQKWSKHDFTERPKKQTQRKESNLFAPAPEGQRNDKAIKICGYLIEKGFSESKAIEFMELWNSSNKPPLQQNELDNLIQSAYRRYQRRRKTFQSIFNQRRH